MYKERIDSFSIIAIMSFVLIVISSLFIIFGQSYLLFNVDPISIGSYIGIGGLFLSLLSLLFHK